MNPVATVLTIEDEPAVRRGIAAYLEDSGYAVLEAGDGVSGIDLMRAQRPDAVLCDLRLPRMDGLEVLSTITHEFPDVPVIVVSGVSDLSYAIQALKRGAWDYVTKPVLDMEVLESALRRALERAHLLQENRRYRLHLETLNRELTRTLDQLRADEQAARKVQIQLLPQERWQFRDYLFTQRLYPSRLLSGDFVDYFAIDERHAGFYMADVSGHGAASAFVTVMLKTLVTQYRLAWGREGDETILCPECTLQRLNTDILHQKLDHYLTMFYGVIDAERGHLSCSNGGQFPYPLLCDGARTEVLTTPSRPLGLFEDADFERRELDLPDPFALWLVSDGALDLLPRATLREKGELLCDCLPHAHAHAHEAASELGLSDVPTQLPDDVTLLAISRQANMPT